MPCASLLFSLAAVVVFLIPDLTDHLQFDRTAIAAGELWRVVTGHFVHYTFDHFTWDLLAFLALGVACERTSRLRLVGCVFTSALVISAAVWFWLPELDLYRGLSGVDSALFGLLTANLWFDDGRATSREQRRIATALFAGFVLKIAFELVTGGTVFVRDVAGSAGVPLAHVVGLGVGLTVGSSRRVAPARIVRGTAPDARGTWPVEVC